MLIILYVFCERTKTCVINKKTTVQLEFVFVPINEARRTRVVSYGWKTDYFSTFFRINVVVLTLIDPTGVACRYDFQVLLSSPYPPGEGKERARGNWFSPILLFTIIVIVLAGKKADVVKTKIRPPPAGNWIDVRCRTTTVETLVRP